MKKIKYTLVLIMLSFSFIACDDDDKGVQILDEGTLNVNKPDLSFGGAGGDEYIDFDSSNDIKIETKQDWITTSIEDKKIKINTPLYLGDTDRTGIVVINSGSLNKVLTVHQSTGKLILEGGNEIGVPLTVNGEYAYDITTTLPSEQLDILFEDEKDKEWIVAADISDAAQLVIKTLPNPLKKQRKSTLYVTFKDGNTVEKVATLTIDSYYQAEDLLGKWQATFNKPTITQEVEIVEEIEDREKKYYLKGFTLYETGNLSIKMPVEFNKEERTWSILIGTYLGKFDVKFDDGVYPYAYPLLRTAPYTSGSGYTWWRPDAAPKTYPSVLNIDENSSQITMNFPNFSIPSYTVGGIVLRLFESQDLTTARSKSTRSIYSLKLKKL